MTKFAIAFLFAILTLAPILIAQAEESRDAGNRKGGQGAGDGLGGPFRRARGWLNARAGRFGQDIARLFTRRAPRPRYQLGYDDAGRSAPPSA